MPPHPTRSSHEDRLRKEPVESNQSGCSSVVERNLAKVDVVGSNPIIRSLSPNVTIRPGFFVHIGVTAQFKLAVAQASLNGKW